MKSDGRVHFIGVGGAGMSAVAYLYVRQGIAVSGSDGSDGPYLRALADAGIQVSVGHDASLVDGASEVVVSSAIRDSNPELAEARKSGLPVLHRSEALRRAVEGKRLIAVAGAHGKTTTAAMTARALHGAGIDATFAIGAPVLGVEGAVGGAYSGTAGVAVVEADESDGSFLAYTPEVAVLTNVEADHLDHYGTLEALHEAFTAFARRARLLVACADDPGAAAVAEAVRREGVAVTTYGTGEGADLRVDGDGVIRGGERFPMVLPQPGAHNRLNAAGAWAAAVAVGAEARRAAEALAEFAGTGRRFEFKGEADSVRVYDDYAHHPTEIAALLAAARERERGRLVVLFQPHLYSRTRLFAREFARALSIPDADIIVTGVYGAREEPEPGVDGSTIGRHAAESPRGTFRVIEDLVEAAREAARLAVPEGAVLTVGAGSVTEAAGWILDSLKEREARRV